MPHFLYLCTGDVAQLNQKMMNDETKETSLKFVSKDEITRAIQALTPFTNVGMPASISLNKFPWAEEKIKELVKLL